MHPKLLTLPGDITVTTYGFCLMLGFLSAVWFAMRRAARVHADPDRVLDVSFFALVFGVAGARAMYVIHYWQTDFAGLPNRLIAVVDIRNGGLEFLGGLIGAATAILIYLAITKQSVRLYLDILAPGAMWGLAFGRIGCFFNGCCFGAVFATGAAVGEQPAWAVRFPFGSLAHVRHWEERRITVPAELVATLPLRARLLSASALAIPVEKRERQTANAKRLHKTLTEARASGADAALIRRYAKEYRVAQAGLEENGLGDVLRAQKFPSRRAPQRQTSVTELEDLASASRSMMIHPTQLYSAFHALLLSALLSTVFHRRKRHGIVIGLLFLLYPIARVLLELIRADNPHDVAGLTISQSISVTMFVLAAIYLFVLYRFLPLRSPVLARS